MGGSSGGALVDRVKVHGWNGLISMGESDGGARLDRAEKHV